MKESETLFHLIRSLSKNEKRNFVLGAQRERGKKDKGYLALYRWYERRKTPGNPDPGTLKQLGLTGNRLAVQKHYLYHRLLESVMAHGREVSPEMRVRQLINKSEVLLSKGMSTASLRLLDTAAALAKACFSYQLQLDILLRREAHIQRYEDVKLVQALSEEKKQLLAVIANMNEYQQLSYAIFAFTRRHDFVRTPAQRRELDRIFTHPLLRNEKLALSPTAKFHMYHALCHYSSLIQDPQLSLEHGRRHLEIFDEEPEATRHELDYYITLLFNITVVATWFGHAREVALGLKRWEELPARFAAQLSPQLALKRRLYDVELKLHLLCLEGRFAGIEKLMPLIRTLSLSPHPYTPVFRETVAYNAAFALYAAGNSRQALRVLSPLVNDEEVEYRRYRLLLKSLVLRLLILHDLGRTETVENLSRQLKNFLQRYGHGKDPESAIPELFIALQKAATESERRKLMQETLQSLRKKLCRAGSWWMAYNQLYFFAWLRAGISKRPLKEMMPETLGMLRKEVRRTFA